MCAWCASCSSRNPHAKLALLIRDRPGQSGQQRADLIVPPEQRSRVQVYSGDVGLPNCGLDTPTYERLSAETTRVIHSAATVRFDHSLDEARRINVEGTRRVLDFAVSARTFAALPTSAPPMSPESAPTWSAKDELAVGQSYRNTYEQTKAEAEALVRSRLGSLPGVILRPSIIVGDSHTGVTSSFKMMYWPLKIYARRLWRTVPGYPDAVLDIVPVDFVAAAVARLAFDEAALGSTVHLCAGPRGSATIQQIASRAMEYFNAPEPRYVDPEVLLRCRPSTTLSRLCGDASAACFATAAPIATTSPCACSLTPPTPSACWNPPELRPPHVLDYLDRLFNYCVASEWGRKPVSAQ